jgi:hypothetical protein
MSSSRPDTAATNRDMDSEENRDKFVWAKEATTYDNLLLDGRISNADVRGGYDGGSGLHWIPDIGTITYDDEDTHHEFVDTDILLSYLLTCDPPADVNGRTISGRAPMWQAVIYNNTSVAKVLIDFGGDRSIKINSDAGFETPLDVATRVHQNNRKARIRRHGPSHFEIIKLLMECFPSEE